MNISSHFNTSTIQAVTSASKLFQGRGLSIEFVGYLDATGLGGSLFAIDSGTGIVDCYHHRRRIAFMLNQIFSRVWEIVCSARRDLCRRFTIRVHDFDREFVIVLNPEAIWSRDGCYKAGHG